MSRKQPVTPSYRLHKPSGQVVVTLNAKDHYLGKFGTAESRSLYDQLVARWLANGRQLPLESEPVPAVTPGKCNGTATASWPTSLTFRRTCPECRSTDYVFRARKTVEPEPGRPAVETKYRCRSCGHTWKEQQPVTQNAA